MHAVFKRELGCTPREYEDQQLATATAQPAIPVPKKKAALASSSTPALQLTEPTNGN